MLDTALANLKSLHLAGHLEDEHMPFLKGCSKLSWLELTRSKITDGGLLHLETLSNLKQLRIVDSKVTDEGVRKLQQALPNCEIRH